MSEVPRNSTVRRDPAAPDTPGEPGVLVDRAAESRAAGTLFLSPPHASTAHASTHATVSRIKIMLEARQLTKEYQSGDHRLSVLRDVSFTIPDGAFVAIVGPSGSGKTTLRGLLAGLDVATRGTVLLDGADMSAMNEDRRAQLRGEKVGFVFQSFQLIPTLTALENVQVPLELRGDDGAPARSRELLARVGLGDRVHHYPNQLSGGVLNHFASTQDGDARTHLDRLVNGRPDRRPRPRRCRRYAEAGHCSDRRANRRRPVWSV